MKERFMQIYHDVFRRDSEKDISACRDPGVVLGNFYCPVEDALLSDFVLLSSHG